MLIYITIYYILQILLYMNKRGLYTHILWLHGSEKLEYNIRNKKGNGFMATVSFDKQFTVKREKVEDFVKSFEQPVRATLPRTFVSQSESIHQSKELRGQLLAALRK